MSVSGEVMEVEEGEQEVDEARIKNYQSPETQQPAQMHPIEVAVEVKPRRNPKPTPKYEEFQNEQIQQRKRSFHNAYLHFKRTLIEVRNHLKGELPEDDLMQLRDTVEKEKDRIIRSHEAIRPHLSDEQAQQHRQKADVIEACTKDILSAISLAIMEVDAVDFDPYKRRKDLHFLKQPYAASIYSERTATTIASQHSVQDQLIHERAELASKRVQLEAKKEEKIQQIELQKMQEERDKLERAIQEKKHQNEITALETECQVARARVAVIESNLDASNTTLDPDAPVYTPHSINPSTKQTTSRSSEFESSATKSHASQSPPPHCSQVSQQNQYFDIATAIAHALDKSRLPVPTPKVFSGKPLEYVHFRRSFKTLIENKAATAEEKIYYLQQYLTGEAKDAVSGCLYGTEEEDYHRAWQILERRFGNTFSIQETYRNRIENWPKLSMKDAAGIQQYADFLRSCLEATHHIRGLKCLNDCKENQKMVAKLPDQLVSRWSRIVTDSLDNNDQYPSFSDFVCFMEKEARVANNPTASFSAIKKSIASEPAKPGYREKEKPSSRTLATSATPISASDASHKREKKCAYCQGDHFLPNCPTFKSKSDEEKSNYIKESKRCFGCLRTGHYTKDCPDRHQCKVCNKRHPTVLHREEKPEVKPEGTRAMSTQCEGTPNTTNVIPVWISSKTNPQIEKLVYALLDTQSDGTFIDESLCNTLTTQGEPVKLKLTTLLGRDAIIDTNKVTGLQIRGYTSRKLIDLPTTYTRETIPLDRESIPTFETANRWPHLKTISQEIPPLLDADVGLLVGYNCLIAFTPRDTITGKDGEPYGVKTDLGWSIVGSPATENSSSSSICHRISIKEMPSVTPKDALNLLERDFADTSLDDATVSQNDIQFLQTLEREIHTNHEGHLEMPLPFKARPHLPDNRSLALTRLMHLKRKLEKDSHYKESYTAFVEKMIEDEDCEMLTDVHTHSLGGAWYLPHHGVMHPQKNKLRVVFDCSARYQSTSLNQHLLQGPDLMNDLFGILCRFRRREIAIVCDIEKMFHRFHVNPADRDYLRFLWWPKGNTSKPPRDFRMKVHLFGATSSPGCANFALKYLATDQEATYPAASSFLRNDFYMDDGLTSVSSCHEAQVLIQEARDLCSQKRIRLHKFISNNREVIEAIPQSERANDLQNIDLQRDLPTQRTLGIRWNIEQDSFSFIVQLKDTPNSRRGILSAIASIYDPLGFISPVVLVGKIILQRICKRGVSWDEPTSNDLQTCWDSWKSDLQSLQTLTIPRRFHPYPTSSSIKVELHHFSDASTQGYGACSYLRFINGNEIHCSLVASKARVAPSKGMTIPRLELTAAVTATKLAQKIRKELKMDISAEYFWCDSQVVLAYISNDATRFHLFVANRVRAIKECTSVDQWHYVATKNNPADHASRGMKVDELVQSNWFLGPSFLREKDFTQDKVQPQLTVGDPEVVAGTVGEAQRTETTQNSSLTNKALSQSRKEHTLLEHLERYSSWELVLKIVARILRLFQQKSQKELISVSEIQEARTRILRLVQARSFKNEFDALKSRGQVPQTSKLCNLDPKLEDGLIRVGGRLQHASLCDSVKHPVILPKDDHFTRAIIASLHTHHAGRSQTLNNLRSQGYWVISGSKTVESLLRNCAGCRRQRRPVEEQKMADLPPERVESSPPFSSVGMDCFGPFTTKDGRKEHNRYGLLFTCLSSRAIHIEMLPDMTTDSFILGLRCFIAIRGAVSIIRCDQGTNFVGANNEFKASMKQLDTAKLSSYLAKKQCQFIFNAPSASHCGGIWERQIRSIMERGT